MFESFIEFFKLISSNVQYGVEILMNSNYYFVYVPLFFLFLWIIETVWFIWYFLPSNIISVTIFAFLIVDMKLFLLCLVIFSLGIFLWLIISYFGGKYFLNKFIIKIRKKYTHVDTYFLQIDSYLDKYHFWAFPVLINIWFVSPIMWIYFGAHKYNLKKFLLGSLIAVLSYVIPRAFIWYLLWVFGKVIFDYMKIGYKYIMYVAFVIIIISFVLDFLNKDQK